MASNPIQLVSVDDLKPAVYNPRKADPVRLDYVKLSLQKLGWVLPIYATKAGEILSGHQRHHVAVQMGYKRVPVVFVPEMEEAQRKSLNILFNKATNDMARGTLTADMYETLRKIDLSFTKKMPDKVVNSPMAFPCMRAVRKNVRELLRHNVTSLESFAAVVGRSMVENFKIFMPLVILQSGEVINGIGRLAAMDGAGVVESDCIVLATDAEAKLAKHMLNLLSMDFDIAGKYADVLRYNSFRRSRGSREWLGQGFITQLPSKHRNKFLPSTPELEKMWKDAYGTRIVDFGAGQRQETAMLRKIGVDAVPFEPFCLKKGTDAVDPELSRQVCRDFLTRIADGTTFDSLFISSVLQSVPFPEDRKAVVAIVSALASPSTKLFVLAKSMKVYDVVIGKGYMNTSTVNTSNFPLEHEPGMTLADYSALPKVQKFYTEEEFNALLEPHWVSVKTVVEGLYIHSVCQHPRKTDLKVLGKALEFEFDLPYPDGSRMGLVSEAKKAFSTRLGVKIP